MLFKKHTSFALLSLMAVLVCHGCGFSLRGFYPVPEAYQSVYVKSAEPYGRFEVLLRRALRQQNLNIAESGASADFSIDVLSNEFQRKVHAIGSDTRVQEFRLRHSVQFQVIDQEGNVILAPTMLTETESYVFDRELVLGKDEEDTMIRRELRRELINAMIERVSAALEAWEANKADS